MGKIKIPKKSPSIDMTPMVDLAFLLVTFFMLISQFRPPESVVVDLPFSVSEIKVPDRNMITISIDKKNRVFINFDGKEARKNALLSLADRYKVGFTQEQIEAFSNLSSVGMPVQQLGEWLNLPDYERQIFEQPGIPVDSLNNQLKEWIMRSWTAKATIIQKEKRANEKIRFAVKGDREANYPALRRVIKILEECQIYKFNFITSLQLESAE